ncbi:MAG: MBL fold metallo-hydrolase, partial [Dehalococcoidia bacterium]|nr:MBL fold metallo-hydrolase [Dehalococcoidia bacterium]
KIMEAANGIKNMRIVITHIHQDHNGALLQARAATAAKVAAHPLDAPDIPGGVDVNLKDGVEINFGSHTVKVVHAPGHTAGSICLLAGQHLIAGDTVFPGGPGKTATPSAFAQILSSITERIYTLPDSTIIYPGHGDSITVGDSKKEYALFNSKPHKKTTCGDVLWLSS